MAVVCHDSFEGSTEKLIDSHDSFMAWGVERPRIVPVLRAWPLPSVGDVLNYFSMKRGHDVLAERQMAAEALRCYGDQCPYAHFKRSPQFAHLAQWQ
jgi:hypothetical protein